MSRRTSRIYVSVIIVLTLLLTSCSGGGDQQPTGAVPGTGLTEPAGGAVTTAPTTAATTGTTPSAAAGMETPQTTGTASAETTETPASGSTTQTPAAGGVTGEGPTFTAEQIGGTVTVLAIWGGAELDNFNAMIQPFEDQTGIQVEVESTRDISQVLNTRLQGGNPPDVAGLPNPGEMQRLARDGSLKTLDDVLDMNAMANVYDKGFLDLTQVDGKTYGIFTKAAVKSLVWYNPKAFEAAGLQVPKTWDELDALEQKIVDMGKTPWCIGVEGGAGSAWPGTDWIEDIMLRTAGPEKYDQWWRHEIPWTDESIKNAWSTWGSIVNDEKMVYGGAQYVLATNFGQAFVPMFEEDPGCFLHRQASFITTFFTEQYPDLKAGEDYNFFVFPPIDEQYGNPLLVAGDLFGMFNDTPQARALIQYLVTAEAQSAWAERGGFLSANKSVDPSIYPDDITRQTGELIVNAPAVRFDASDLMPQEVNTAFSQGILQFVGNNDQLDSVLETIESQAESAYQPTQ